MGSAHNDRVRSSRGDTDICSLQLSGEQGQQHSDRYGKKRHGPCQSACGKGPGSLTDGTWTFSNEIQKRMEC